MEQEFWLERWRQNQTGFHAEQVNPHLLSYWQDFGLPDDAAVLVPLCGKSKDMPWLANQGYQVIGIELSPLAVDAFAAENNLQVNKTTQDKFEVNNAGNITLYCGDFFDLMPAALGPVAAVYDRAALIALPPDMRGRYANHLRTFLAPGAIILLVSLEYDELEMAGPPFSVSASEVEMLYGPWCKIHPLASKDVLDEEPRFRERGLSGLREQVYTLTVNK